MRKRKVKKRERKRQRERERERGREKKRKRERHWIGIYLSRNCKRNLTDFFLLPALPLPFVGHLFILLPFGSLPSLVLFYFSVAVAGRRQAEDGEAAQEAKRASKCAVLEEIRERKNKRWQKILFSVSFAVLGH